VPGNRNSRLIPNTTTGTNQHNGSQNPSGSTMPPMVPRQLISSFPLIEIGFILIPENVSEHLMLQQPNKRAFVLL
jgi:hypothetical protein